MTVAWYRMKVQEASQQKEYRKKSKEKEKAYERDRTYDRALSVAM